MIKKIIQKIQAWYINLPEKGSGRLQFDKTIIRSLGENLQISFIFIVIAVLTSFIDEGLSMLAVIVGITAFLKDATKIFIKFLRDYSKL